MKNKVEDIQENPGNVELSKEDFARLKEFIEFNLGIKMPDSKKILVQSRLNKTLRKSGYSNYTDYVDYILSDNGMLHREEVLNAITTNKTDFFREPGHFDILINKIVKTEWQNRTFSSANPIKIWSAGCSTGQEPYTLAMILEEHKNMFGSLEYSILATDVDTSVLQKAQAGIYKAHLLNEIPDRYRKHYFRIGKGRQDGYIRIVPYLRKKILFAHLNLMSNNYGIDELFDVIFCRNVLIYFDKEMQERFVRNFYEHLKPGGFLFLGHSETMTGMKVPFSTYAPTVYRK